MAFPLYVLLPDGVEWTAVPGTVAQRTSPVKWYLRQSMPLATTQTAVLVSDEGGDQAAGIDAVIDAAQALGGMTIDGQTQEPISHGGGAAVGG